MSKTVILLKDLYLYQGKKYTEDEFTTILNKIKSKINIIIAENEIFISKYNLNNQNIEDFLEEIMEKNETYNENILTDYYFNKDSNILYVYSLNEGKKVNDISLKSNNIKVIPIQFYIKNLFKKKLYKKKEVLILAKVDTIIYSIFCENNHITYSNLFSVDEFNILDELKKSQKVTDVLIDKELFLDIDKESLNNYNVKVKSIGRVVYEKLYKIQRFSA